MQAYDPSKPLFFLHVPKTAGNSVRAIFEEWFGDGLVTHYPPSAEVPPTPIDDLAGPICVFGHFNRRRGFSIEERYPEASQFLTFLRDPWERMLSGYFFAKAKNIGARNPQVGPVRSMEEFFARTDIGVEAFLPAELEEDPTVSGLARHFLEVGLVEEMDASLQRMAAALGKTYTPGQAGRRNATPRNEAVPEGAEAEYRARNPLQYTLYEAARARCS